MNSLSEIEVLKIENKKLRSYISLVLAENELLQRIYEIRENFSNSSDSQYFIMPILDRITKIKSEKMALQKELNLN